MKSTEEIDNAIEQLYKKDELLSDTIIGMHAEIDAVRDQMDNISQRIMKLRREKRDLLACP